MNRDLEDTTDHMYCKRCGIMILRNFNYRTDGYCLRCRIAIFDKQYSNTNIYDPYHNWSTITGIGYE